MNKNKKIIPKETRTKARVEMASLPLLFLGTSDEELLRGEDGEEPAQPNLGVGVSLGTVLGLLIMISLYGS